MKVRISGTKEECERLASALESSFDLEVISTSQFYPWKRKDPKSKEGAVYLEVRA